MGATDARRASPFVWEREPQTMPAHPNRNRSGHLPGHIRDTFGQAIDAFLDGAPGDPPLLRYEIHYRERLISIAEACKLVWGCTDILPDLARRQLTALRIPPVSDTYAAAAHVMLAELRTDGRVDDAADIARRRVYDARDAAWRDLEGWALDHQEPSTTVPPCADPAAHVRERARIARWHARGTALATVERYRDQLPAEPTELLEKLLAAIVTAERVIEARDEVAFGCA